jgi:hypothetical protein
MVLNIYDYLLFVNLCYIKKQLEFLLHLKGQEFRYYHQHKPMLIRLGHYFQLLYILIMVLIDCMEDTMRHKIQE